jgi:hypothetical protein
VRRFVTRERPSDRGTAGPVPSVVGRDIPGLHGDGRRDRHRALRRAAAGSRHMI